MRIAIDAMGGEGGAEFTVPASTAALSEYSTLELILLGDESIIRPMLHSASKNVLSRLSIQHTKSVISDQDKPTTIFRGERVSSMYLAAQLVQDGAVSAMVSAGNTGALIMAGRHLLKTIPGIHKPALVATIPGISNETYLLDVGANPDCSGQQLFEFAVMGSVLAESQSGRQPRVGLLNIGSEQHKGTEEVQVAADLLEHCKEINYIGFVEAGGLFQGVADVVVCDGFVGNVTIKASAGVANVVSGLVAEQSPQGPLAWLGQYFVATAMANLRRQINPQRFNGASLLGLQGSIIKSHGNATVEGFGYAIKEAIVEVELNIPQLIAEKVAAIMSNNQTPVKP
jgi:glycerol-3-phosphate acyltransferase PlsX